MCAFCALECSIQPRGGGGGGEGADRLLLAPPSTSQAEEAAPKKKKKRKKKDKETVQLQEADDETLEECLPTLLSPNQDGDGEGGDEPPDVIEDTVCEGQSPVDSLPSKKGKRKGGKQADSNSAVEEEEQTVVEVGGGKRKREGRNVAEGEPQKTVKRKKEPTAQQDEEM